MEAMAVPACFNTRGISFLRCPGDVDENAIRLSEFNVRYWHLRTSMLTVSMPAFRDKTDIRISLANARKHPKGTSPG